MFNRRIPGLLTALTLTGLAVSAQTAARADGTLITFDDISTNAVGTAISNGYQGFDWNNLYVLNTPDVFAGFGADGYTNGTVSSPNVAFNGDGSPASFASTSTPFTANSFYLTSAFNDGLMVTVTGLNGATQLYTQTFTVGTSGPTLETLDWSNLTELDFASVGGTHHSGYIGSGTEFALDNLTVNATSVVTTTPEPASYAAFAMGGIGLLGLGLKARKRSAQ